MAGSHSYKSDKPSGLLHRKQGRNNSYRIPVFSWKGPILYFAAYRYYLELYVVSRQILEQFKTDLKPFKVSGTTTHFSAAHPLPASLVTGIVRARITEKGSGRHKAGRISINTWLFYGDQSRLEHTIKMPVLMSIFQARRFEHVETVFTTRNMVFETERTDIALTGEIADLLPWAFSPEIPVILRSMDNLMNIRASDPFRAGVLTPDRQVYS